MTLEPLLHAPIAVQIHVATVLPAFVIGTWQIFFSHKGAPLHRTLGTLYLVLMAITATAAIFIRSPPGSLIPTFYGFTPIHIFVLVTYFGVFRTVFALIRHNYKEHKSSMLGLYAGGLLIAGTLAFLPGRIMNAVAFGN